MSKLLFMSFFLPWLVCFLVFWCTFFFSWAIQCTEDILGFHVDLLAKCTTDLLISVCSLTQTAYDFLTKCPGPADVVSRIQRGRKRGPLLKPGHYCLSYAGHFASVLCLHSHAQDQNDVWAYTAELLRALYEWIKENAECADKNEVRRMLRYTPSTTV